MTVDNYSTRVRLINKALGHALTMKPGDTLNVSDPEFIARLQLDKAGVFSIILEPVQKGDTE